MSYSTDTITFFDAEELQNATVIVRTADQAVGLCVSLEHNGDVEVFLPVSTCEIVVSALQRAIATLRRQTGDPPAT